EWRLLNSGDALMKSWLPFASALTLAFLSLDCQGHSTTAPSPSPAATKSALHLTGRITDNIQRPLASATLTVTEVPGALAITCPDGSYTLSDATLVDTTVTVNIFKDRYAPASAKVRNDHDANWFLTPVDLLTIDGQYAITFTADDSCTQLPAAARSRTY